MPTEKNISNQIDEIIKKRKEKLPSIEERKKKLNDILETLNTFETHQKEMFDESGEVRSTGEYSKILTSYPEVSVKLSNVSVKECKKRIKKALKDADTAYNRFNSDNINIAIVGGAGSGKSLLLQSISGLSGKIIPSANGDDCTGARSQIINRSGDTKAVIYFRNEQEMVEIVQKYLDEIISDENKRVRVHNLYDIQHLNIEEVGKLCSAGDSRRLTLIDRHLSKYVKHFDDWSEDVKKYGNYDKTKTITVKTSDDENKIQKYVSQYDALLYDTTGEEVKFYKYLSVKKCEIYCEFEYKDAGKIKLVDTVGLGDTTIGIGDEMLDAVGNNDAAILLHRPKDPRHNGIDDLITGAHDNILHKFKERSLDKWLFWIINDDKRVNNHEKLCKTALQEINKTINLDGKKTYLGALKEIIDISDTNIVRDFLVRMLDSLTDNLEEIDKLFLDDFDKSYESVKAEYKLICAGTKNIFDGTNVIGQDIITALVSYKEQLNNQISTELKKICDYYAQTRDDDCDELNDEIKKLFDKMNQSDFVPDINWIQMKLQGGMNSDVFITCTNLVRNKIVANFAALNPVMDNMFNKLKNEIANVMMKTSVQLNDGSSAGALKNILPLEEGKPEYEWLKDFANEKLKPEKNYPNFINAFMNLYNFEFSVNGFLTYEVRACLDGLDTNRTGVPAFNNNNVEDVAHVMHSSLVAEVVNTQFYIKARLKDIIKRPNKALYAAATDFRDRMIFSENDDEWNHLLLDNSRDLWSNVYKSAASHDEDFKNLNTVIEMLIQYEKEV